MKHQFKIFLIIFPILFILNVAQGEKVGNEMFFLITEAEAAAEDGKSLFVPRTDGPKILVSEPDSKVTYSEPLSIHLEFIPGKNGNEVDMETFSIKYKKFVAINLTSRVSEYISENKIIVPEFDLPSGKHNLEVSIRDVQGKLSSQIISVRRGK